VSLAKIRAINRMWGVATQNEERENDGRPPVAGGDRLWMPANMQPLGPDGLFLEPPAKPDEPVPADNLDPSGTPEDPANAATGDKPGEDDRSVTHRSRGFTGRKHTEETKARISAARRAMKKGYAEQ
jgi:hypothetical protein